MVTLSSCLICQKKIVLYLRCMNMVLYTLDLRWKILRRYFESHGNTAECMRKLLMDFGRWEEPSASYVRYLVNKVKETGILIDKPKHEEPKTVRTTENIAAVPERVPSTSIHRRSQLNISESLLRWILHKDLGITPYKVSRFRFRSWNQL